MPRTLRRLIRNATPSFRGEPPCGILHRCIARRRLSYAGTRDSRQVQQSRRALSSEKAHNTAPSVVVATARRHASRNIALLKPSAQPLLAGRALLCGPASQRATREELQNGALPIACLSSARPSKIDAGCRFLFRVLFFDIRLTTLAALEVCTRVRVRHRRERFSAAPVSPRSIGGCSIKSSLLQTS